MNENHYLSVTLSIIVLAMGAACGEDEAAGDDCEVAPPASWSAPNWDVNTQATQLLQQLATLTGATVMQGAETGAVTLSRADLDAAYAAGSPSLESISSPAMMGRADNAFDEFLAAVDAGARDLVSDSGTWEPGAAGGIWSTRKRAFNSGGLELRQIVNMGLFGGGAFYGYALGLTAQPIDEATVDALAVLFGANSGLNPGRSNDAVVANQNKLSANYVYQMGFYARAREALTAAKAYAVSDTCVAQRDAAVQTFFRAWEQGLFARFIYYSNAGAEGVAEAADHEALAAALHEQSEGAGLALGFYGAPSPAAGPMKDAPRLMTDARIAEALAALGVDVDDQLGTATVGTFVSDPLGYSSAVRAAEQVVADVFGVSEAELASYRTPTDG